MADGAVVSTPAASGSSGGLSSGAIFAIGALVLVGAGAAYYFFVYEKDNLTADAKFNRDIQFVKGVTDDQNKSS